MGNLSLLKTGKCYEDVNIDDYNPRLECGCTDIMTIVSAFSGEVWVALRFNTDQERIEYEDKESNATIMTDAIGSPLHCTQLDEIIADIYCKIELHERKQNKRSEK